MTPRIKVKPKKRVVKAWTVVNRCGPVLTDVSINQFAIYRHKREAIAHGRPFKWESVVRCEIVYHLPKRKAK